MMNSLDYVEAVMRQHESERERDWALRFREQHPDHGASSDSRWAGFIHRWAERANESQASGGSSLDDRLMVNREVDR